jgi:hypothetical protein
MNEKNIEKCLMIGTCSLMGGFFFLAPCPQIYPVGGLAIIDRKE